MFSIPAFGESEFVSTRINDRSTVVLISNTLPDLFARYRNLLLREGFSEKEAYRTPLHSFAAFEKDGTGVFINAFSSTGELQLVTQDHSAYFRYEDCPGDPVTTSALTQVKLTDYGLSYVVRLEDDRFVVIDGGNRVDQEADALYHCLKQQSVSDVPVIAAWIMTHPHSDHFYCYFPFMERHGADVKIEKFLFHFPDADDLLHYPKLERQVTHFPECTAADVVKHFLDSVKESNIPVYTPHTGQQYKIGNAVLRFFATLDDTIHCSQNINATSLMFMMEIAGQRIFFGADGSAGYARLPDRYGQELKADILQIPHHGFGCGSEEAMIQCYRLVAPRVCLLPASHSEAYRSFATYRESTNYLMTRQNVEEMITGKVQRTLELPYAPRPEGAIEMRQQYLQGRDDSGARTWIFTDLNTAKKDDFVFMVLNTTYINAELSVELFFENMEKKIVCIATEAPRRGVFRINCLLNADEDPSALADADYMRSKDIPEDTVFAVRFVSSVPVVISHADHAAAYHSTVV